MLIPKLLLICPILSSDDKLFFFFWWGGSLSAAARLNPRWYVLKCSIYIPSSLDILPQSGSVVKQFTVWEGQGESGSTVCQKGSCANQQQLPTCMLVVVTHIHDLTDTPNNLIRHHIPCIQTYANVKTWGQFMLFIFLSVKTLLIQLHYFLEQWFTWNCAPYITILWIIYANT